LLLEAQAKGSASLRSVGNVGFKQKAEQLRMMFLIDVFLYRSRPACFVLEERSMFWRSAVKVQLFYLHRQTFFLHTYCAQRLAVSRGGAGTANNSGARRACSMPVAAMAGTSSEYCSSIQAQKNTDSSAA
jgi:hypothetical protein